MAGKTSKRSQPVSMEEKIAAIARVQAGESKASVARDLVIPESTLRGWCKNEKKITFLTNKRLSSPDSDDSGSNGAKVARRARKSSPITSRDRWSDLITQSEQFQYNTPTFTQATGASVDYSTVMQNWSMFFQQLQGMPSTTSSWATSGVTPVTAASTTSSQSAAVSTPAMTNRSDDQLTWLSQQALLRNMLAPTTTATTQSGSSVNNMALAAYALNAYKLNLLSSTVGPSTLPTARVSPVPATSRSTSASPLSSIYGCKSEPINLSEPRSSCSDGEEAPLNMTVNNHSDHTTNNHAAYNHTTPIASSSPIASTEDKKDNVENTISVVITEPRQEVEKPRNLKNRTVLDTLYHNNNNNIEENVRDKPKQTREEGVNHGEMFLSFLKDCGEPFVTQVQVSLVANLLRNFHNSDTRKFKRSKRK